MKMLRLTAKEEAELTEKRIIVNRSRVDNGLEPLRDCDLLHMMVGFALEESGTSEFLQ